LESRSVSECHFHPETPGVGICMRCRTVICAACCTRLQGINHCHECLRAMARTKVQSSAGGGTILAALGLLGLVCALLFGMWWLVEGSLAP
jgi:hypothetical protein